MEDIAPLQQMAPNDKYSVVIEGATFAWDKLKSLNADNDEIEDEEIDEKEVANGMDVDAVSVSVDDSKPGKYVKRL